MSETKYRQRNAPVTSNCKACGTTRSMEFECVECCIRWLSTMDRETMAYNAPAISYAVSPEHLEKVRSAMRERIADAKKALK